MISVHDVMEIMEIFKSVCHSKKMCMYPVLHDTDRCSIVVTNAINTQNDTYNHTNEVLCSAPSSLLWKSLASRVESSG